MSQLLRVLNKLPKDLQNDVRDASQEIANALAAGARNAAATPQQNLAATGLKAKRDRVPVVTAGAGMLRPGVKVADVFYGAEFGGRRRTTTQQFPSWRGNDRSAGYFLYPTARNRGKQFAEMWAEAIDKAFKDWDYTAR